MRSVRHLHQLRSRRGSIQDRSTVESIDADPCSSPVTGQRMSIPMAKWLKRIPGPTPKVKPTAMMNQCGVFRVAPERWLVLRHHAQCMQADLLRWQVMRAFPSATDDCLWCVGWQRIHPLSVCQRWRECTLRPCPFPLSSLRSPPSKPWDLVTFLLDWLLFTVVAQRPQMPFGIGANSSLPLPSPPFSHRQHNRGGTMVNCWNPMGGAPRMVGGRHLIDSRFWLECRPCQLPQWVRYEHYLEHYPSRYTVWEVPEMSNNPPQSPNLH